MPLRTFSDTIIEKAGSERNCQPCDYLHFIVILHLLVILYRKNMYIFTVSQLYYTDLNCAIYIVPDTSNSVSVPALLLTSTTIS